MGLCGLEVDDQLNLCRLLDWQVGGFFALEDAASVDPNQTVGIDKAATVADQAT